MEKTWYACPGIQARWLSLMPAPGGADGKERFYGFARKPLTRKIPRRFGVETLLAPGDRCSGKGKGGLINLEKSSG
jgi:hypothetical protein